MSCTQKFISTQSGTLSQTHILRRVNSRIPVLWDVTLNRWIATSKYWIWRWDIPSKRRKPHIQWNSHRARREESSISRLWKPQILC